MKAFQLVLLIGVMVAPHLSWAAEGMDTQTLAPGVKASPKDLTPAEPLPAVQRDRFKESEKKRNESGAATIEGITKIDPEQSLGEGAGQALGEGAGNILDADQARGMRDVKDMMDAGRISVEEAESGLGGGGGLIGADGRPIDMSKPGGDAGGGFEDPTGRLPDMSSNRGGNPLIPSTNPGDWVSGAAGQDGNTKERRHDTYTEGADGTPYRSQRIIYRSNTTGGVTITRINYRENSTTRTSMIETRYSDDGSAATETHVGYDENGEESDSGIIVFYRDDGSGEEPSEGWDRIQDPDNVDDGGAWARWMMKWSGQRPDFSLKNPDQVNPGPDGATPDPKAPRLVWPEDQLVINPDPDNVSGPERTPDQRTRRQMEDLKDGVGPGARPPGERSIGDVLNADAPQGQ